MNETLRSKLERLLEDENIWKVEINIKCKTKDGMIYTLDSCEYERPDEKHTLPFADGVHNNVTGNLLHITDVIEKGDGYWLSTEELVSIKHTEIVRVWAELGDLYIDELTEGNT